MSTNSDTKSLVVHLDTKEQILVILNYHRLNDEANIGNSYTSGLSFYRLRQALIKIASYDGQQGIIERHSNFPRSQLMALRDDGIITWEGDTISNETEIKLVLERFFNERTSRFYMSNRPEIEETIRRALMDVGEE